MHLVIDELAQAGFALRVEARSHPRELVRPGLGPMQRVLPHLPAIDQRAHEESFHAAAKWNRRWPMAPNRSTSSRLSCWANVRA